MFLRCLIFDVVGEPFLHCSGLTFLLSHGSSFPFRAPIMHEARILLFVVVLALSAGPVPPGKPGPLLFLGGSLPNLADPPGGEIRYVLSYYIFAP